MKTALVVPLLLGACSDEPRACDLAQADDLHPKCRDAMIIALRETSTLRPTDDEILAVYEFLEELRPISCYFSRTVALYQYGSPWQPVIASTNPVLVEPWCGAGPGRHDQIETGDPVADALFKDRGAFEVDPRATCETFELRFDRPVSWDVLDVEVRTLADTSVVLEDVQFIPRDIRRVRNAADDAWIVTFVFAWGDCLLGCDGSHQWDVLVPDDGTEAAIVAESGDEIPEELRCTGE